MTTRRQFLRFLGLAPFVGAGVLAGKSKPPLVRPSSLSVRYPVEKVTQFNWNDTWDTSPKTEGHISTTCKLHKGSFEVEGPVEWLDALRVYKDGNGVAYFEPVGP